MTRLGANLVPAPLRVPASPLPKPRVLLLPHRAPLAPSADPASRVSRRTHAGPRVDRLAPLAAARVPLFAIHGDIDKVVPLEANSGVLKERYTALGGAMELIVPAGQGHNLWRGFFECAELVAFVQQHARR